MTPGTRAAHFGHFLIHREYYGDNLLTDRPHSTRGWTKSNHFGLQSQIFRSGPVAAKLGHYPPGPNSVYLWRAQGEKLFNKRVGTKFWIDGGFRTEKGNHWRLLAKALKTPNPEMMDLQRDPKFEISHFGLLAQTLQSGP